MISLTFFTPSKAEISCTIPLPRGDSACRPLFPYSFNSTAPAEYWIVNSESVKYPCLAYFSLSNEDIYVEAVIKRIPPKARESMVITVFFLFFEKFMIPNPEGVRFLHIFLFAAFFIPSCGTYRKASIGDTAAARRAGFRTETIVITYTPANTDAIIKNTLHRLNPSGIMKYPAIPPSTIPMGAEPRNNILPSRETNFFICFFVIPMVRS